MHVPLGEVYVKLSKTFETSKRNSNLGPAFPWGFDTLNFLTLPFYTFIPVH